MANKNLIRRMRQLLTLVLVLAMTMSFATMTAMATPGNGNGNSVGQQSIHIHLVNGTLPLGAITLTINELNVEDGTSKYAIDVSGTVKDGGKLISAELGENNGISTISTKIEYLDANGNRGVITLTKKGEGNDIGQDGIIHPDEGLNNYWANFTQYEPIENPTPASLNLTATKTLDGNTPGVKTFSFTLKQGDTEVDTAVNNNSNISFKELTFKEAGTYTYTISEVKGDDTDITYDETVYTVEVKVTVSDDGNKLVATPTYKKAGEAGEVVQEAVFANTTNTKSPEVPEGPTPASLSLTAKKTLDGNAPEKDEVFSFTLKNGETEVETVVNKNSNISFKELTFKEAGTYTYTISEVKGDDADITYDETVYTVEVKVTVSDDGNKLVAIPTYKKAGEAGEVVQEAVFANTTKESGNGGNGNGGDGNGGNNGGNTGGNGGQLPPDQNLENPDTPNTPAEPVEPSEKPLPDDKHTVTEVPKTGDAGADALALNLLLLSISALTGMAFYLRRKTTNR